MNSSASTECTKHVEDQAPLSLLYSFHKLSSTALPCLPLSLQTNIYTESVICTEQKGSDKVNVFVRLLRDTESNSCISLDLSNNTLILSDPLSSKKINGPNSSKLFPVETVIDENCPIIDICSKVLKNVIRAVAGGEDACVISFGNTSSMDPNVMLGSDKSPSTLGIVPCAMLWLYNYITVIRKAQNSRFSIRISAIAMSENEEIWRDLLSKLLTDDSQSSKSPVVLRARDVWRAYYYLDYALTERSKSVYGTLSHMLLTIHLYQYHTEEDSGINGGCSRLHLVDLGRDNDSSSVLHISNVIASIWGGHENVPNSERYLAQLLRKSVMQNHDRILTSMIFNVSCKKEQYDEAHHLVQLASKITRQKINCSKVSLSTRLDHCADSFSVRRMKTAREEGGNSEISDVASLCSDMDATSNSDLSCDTVIFRGQRADAPPSSQRGLADGSSNNQIKSIFLDPQEEKSCIKLSQTRHTRRNIARTGSRVWPKTAVKKGLQAMKSGHELWVDGPQAFCVHGTRKEDLSDEVMPGLEQGQSSTLSRAQLVELSLKMDDCVEHLNEFPEKISCKEIIKSDKVTNWLSKQPLASDGVIQEVFYSKIQKKYECNLLANNQQYTRTDIITSRSDQLDENTSSKNLSRIEEWIRSVTVDPSKNGPYPNNTEIEEDRRGKKPYSNHPENCSPNNMDSSPSFSPILHLQRPSILANSKSLSTDKHDVSATVKQKANQKDGKKKDSKKSFNFFNQLIKSRKSKKNKHNDEQLLDCSDFISGNEPNVPSINSYPKRVITGAESSGHGSDCSSINGTKTSREAADLHPKGENCEEAPSHRTGSSGYQSIVRDSGFSSHDSASDCSASRNVPPCFTTVQATIVDEIATLSNNLADKQGNKYRVIERKIPIVSDLIKSEKIHALETEREQIKNDLVETMAFYNIGENTIRTDVEKIIKDVDGGDYSTESLRSTNQILRSVLNHYRGNICMTTSFLSKSGSDSNCALYNGEIHVVL